MYSVSHLPYNVYQSNNTHNSQEQWRKNFCNKDYQGIFHNNYSITNDVVKEASASWYSLPCGTFKKCEIYDGVVSDPYCDRLKLSSNFGHALSGQFDSQHEQFSNSFQKKEQNVNHLATAQGTSLCQRNHNTTFLQEQEEGIRKWSAFQKAHQWTENALGEIVSKKTKQCHAREMLPSSPEWTEQCVEFDETEDIVSDSELESMNMESESEWEGVEDASAGEDSDDVMITQLLEFSRAISKDIQKYFGRKNDDDWCDIYEDKFKSVKSGRELYYRDLLRVAQHGGKPQDEVHDRKEHKLIMYVEDRRSKTPDGKMVLNAGLGPLAELFEVMPKDCPETSICNEKL